MRWCSPAPRRARGFAGRFGPAAAVLLAAGCSGPAVCSVAGTVTVNGKPPGVPNLFISFLGPAGVPVMVPVAEDGTYTAGGVPVGEVRVGFSQSDPAADWDEEKRHTGTTPARPRPADMKSVVPARYRDPMRSGLALTTTRGTNRFDVALTGSDKPSKAP